MKPGRVPRPRLKSSRKLLGNCGGTDKIIRASTKKKESNTKKEFIPPPSLVITQHEVPVFSTGRPEGWPGLVQAAYQACLPSQPATAHAIHDSTTSIQFDKKAL